MIRKSSVLFGILITIILTGCTATESHIVEPSYLRNEQGVVLIDKENPQNVSQSLAASKPEEKEKVKEDKVEAKVEAPTPTPVNPTPPPVSIKGYKNEDVSTSKTGTVYSANGSKVMNGDKVVVDLSKITSSSPKYTQEIAQHYFISDLASSKESNDTAIYVIGLGFERRYPNYNDTKEYYNQMVMVGRPYVVVFKHLVNSNKTTVLLSQANYGTWTAQHFDTKFNELLAKQADNSVYKGENVYVDFLKDSILPHMIYDKKSKHLIAITGDNNIDTAYQMHTKVSLLNIDPMMKEQLKQVYFEIRHFQEPFTSYGKHHVDTHMFYLAEQDDGTVAMASIGQPDSTIATAFSLDINAMNTIQHYWRNRDEVMSLVQ